VTTAAAIEKCQIVRIVEEYRAAGKAVNDEHAAWLEGRKQGL
jgi:hypothetical protein